ncbi:MAG TPA: sulfotransferase [Steroidobacteraceae bacterium]
MRRIRGLLEKRHFRAGLACASTLLREVPENRDVLYLVAVCERYLGDVPAALASLEHFERLHPQFARLFQERGHCYRTLGKTALAIEAYQRAVALNPALLASWRMLAALWRSIGQRSAAASAEREITHLAQLAPAVLSAAGMMTEGDVDGAERVLRQFLLAHPNDVEAMRLLAQIGTRLDVLDDAEFLLESALQFAPDFHLARYDYAGVLARRHKHAAALEEARKLLAIEPGNRAFRTLYATICVGVGSHEEALRVFRELLHDAPEPAELHLSIAHALKTLGHQSQAIAAYRAAAAARPGFGDAYWSLANLKTYRFENAQIEAMRVQEAAPSLAVGDRYHLCFALGKALEDRGAYAESFHYYARGNALKKAESRYRPDQLERALQRQIETFTRPFLESRRGWGCPAPDPIFIVGLPRAGSTLLEQILASHSKVEGTMELADIPRLAAQLQGREESDSVARYPAVLTELSAVQLAAFGAKYLQDTCIYRGRAAQARPFFIDKMPNNFRHLGLIQLILPNAKIIDARREPLACCVSNFKQLFASGQEFTYELADIGRYYRAYVRLMEHWNEVLPGKILRVQHEDVVADLEGSIRRMLEFCGLEYEPACLQYHRTQRSVRTASSEQVRQPIFTEGLDQWRHFEPWLGALREALAPERG